MLDTSGSVVLKDILDASLMSALGTDLLHKARLVFGGIPTLEANFIGLMHSIQLIKDQTSAYLLSSEASNPGSVLFSIQEPTQKEGLLLHDFMHSHKFRSDAYSTKFERRALDHAFKHSLAASIDSHFTDVTSPSGVLAIKRFEAMVAVDSYIDKQFIDGWAINNNYAFKVTVTNLFYKESPLSYSDSQRTFPLYSFEYTIPGTTTKYSFGLYHYLEDQTLKPNEGWLQLKFFQVQDIGILNLISAHPSISLKFGSR